MSVLSSLYHASPPSAAVEISSTQVSAATIGRRGGQAVVSSHVAVALADGALVPSLTAANIHDRAAVMRVLTRVIEQVGGPHRVGLVVPDVVAKVSLVRFEQVPARTADLDQLVRWQVRKAAPFAIEEAQVSYAPGYQSPEAHEGQEFIVSLARRAVIEEYEGLCAEAGAQAGIVDISTFSVINAVLAGAPAPPADLSRRSAAGADGDWLLVHVAADYASIAILRGPHVIFFRNRAADTDGTLADLVHQTAMYYEDRLKGGGFARVVLAGGAGSRSQGDVDQVRRSLQERLTTKIDTVDLLAAAALADRISAAAPMVDTLAPLVGMLLRDREAA